MPCGVQECVCCIANALLWYRSPTVLCGANVSEVRVQMSRVTGPLSGGAQRAGLPYEFIRLIFSPINVPLHLGSEIDQAGVCPEKILKGLFACLGRRLFLVMGASHRVYAAGP